MRRGREVLLRAGVLAALLFMLSVLSPAPAQAAAKISRTNAWLKTGDTVRLKVTGTKDAVTWTSSRPQVAQVSASGKVSALKKGVCVITARAGKKTFTCRVSVAANRWMKLLNRWRHTRVDRLIFVKYTGGSGAKVAMWKKYTEGGKTRWEKIVSCRGYVGKNGIDKVREGDKRTPTGGFPITMAFGRLPTPGTAGIRYTRLNSYQYWSGERETYNTLVDSRKLGHVPAGSEHLIDYDPAYNYALAIGYNPGNVYGKGSAIFLHATSGSPWTAGCVAVPEAEMKKILQNTTRHTRICIYPE